MPFTGKKRDIDKKKQMIFLLMHKDCYKEQWSLKTSSRQWLDLMVFSSLSGEYMPRERRN